MKSTSHYLALLLVITFGTAAGHLVSNYLSATYLNLALKKASANADKAIAVQKQELKEYLQANTIKIAQQTETERLAAMHQRDNSPLGKQLQRDCEDWLTAKKNTPGYTTERESKKKCNKYHEYIETGRLID